MSIQAAFSPSRHFLAVVLNSTLKVWDTRTGNAQGEFRPSDHLANEVTSLAWTTAAPDGSVSVEQDSLIALGNSAGNVVVWNLATGEVHLELNKKNAQILGSIRHIAINAAQTHLYACSKSNAVVEYSLQTGALTRSLVAEDGSSVGGFGRLAISGDGSKLLGASSKVVLWDVASGTQLAAFVGHASVARDLAFLPSGKHFVSVGADKLLNIWAAKGGIVKTAKKHTRKKVRTYTKPRVKLIASADVESLHVQAASSSSAVVVCCLCHGGDVDLWKIDVKKEKATAPQQAHENIVCERADDSDDEDDPAHATKGRAGGIFALSRGTSATGEQDVLLARGSPIHPRFEHAAVEAKGGALESSTLEFVDTTAILKGGGKGEDDSHNLSAGVSSSAAAQRSAHVMGARDSDATITGQKRKAPTLDGNDDEDDGNSDSEADATVKRIALEADAEPDAQTMEERLEAMRQFTEKRPEQATEGSANGGTVDFGSASQSLVTVLQQALHANDKAKLEYCLAVHDKEIITTTVNNLPATCILPFLRQLVDRLERSPRRGRVLVNWLRKILLRHTAYLMTVPDLAKELAALYEIIQSRSALYSDFCRLSGRVDVLLAQLTQRKSLQLAATQKQKPVVFKDTSDNEDEGDNDGDSDSGDHSDSDEEKEEEEENDDQEVDGSDDDDDDVDDDDDDDDSL